MGVKFGTEASVPNFTPIGATGRSCGVKKPKNRPLSKLNIGRFALRAMLPVIKSGLLNGTNSFSTHITRSFLSLLPYMFCSAQKKALKVEALRYHSEMAHSQSAVVHQQHHTTPHHNRYGPFSQTTRVSRCQKGTSGLYGARED